MFFGIIGLEDKFIFLILSFNFGLYYLFLLFIYSRDTLNQTNLITRVKMYLKKILLGFIIENERE